MRIGLLSDVHANLPALRAALRALQDRGVDRLLVAGDIVGYGGQPNECIVELADAGAGCVLGNHDLFVLDRLPPTRFPEVARRSADVTRSLLSSDSRSFLGSLPLTLRLENMIIAHGSLDDPEEYVVSRSRAAQLLSRLPQEAPGSDTLILGHTHRQCLWSADRDTRRPRGRIAVTAPALINPGSVGQSRQRERSPKVRCALYDSGARSVEFIHLSYDVESSRAILRKLNLPDVCLHAPPSARRQVLGVCREVWARVSSTA